MRLRPREDRLRAGPYYVAKNGDTARKNACATSYRRNVEAPERGLPSAPLSDRLKFPATIGTDLTIRILSGQY